MNYTLLRTLPRGILFHTIKVQKIKEMNKGWEGIVLQRPPIISVYLLLD